MVSNVEPRLDRAAVLTVALAAVFAFAIGVAVGFVTTFTHHQYLPWGLVIGLAVIVALITGFRLVFDSRIIAGAAALGLILATGVLMLPGAGGSVFVVDDPAGYIWAIAPTLLAVTVVAWPRRRIETP
jgi:N-acetyl-1-D-myo-inositol-2-amino-2-deoxy-alpha-D-glucopyranoside deacetylase